MTSSERIGYIFVVALGIFAMVFCGAYQARPSYVDPFNGARYTDQRVFCMALGNDSVDYSRKAAWSAITGEAPLHSSYYHAVAHDIQIRQKNCLSETWK